MKVNKITPQINDTSFQGVWGKKKLVNKINSEHFQCDCYEKIYYPFNKESEAEIQLALRRQNAIYSDSFAQQIARFPNNPWITIIGKTFHAKLGDTLELTKEDCQKIANEKNLKMPHYMKEYKRLLKKIK